MKTYSKILLTSLLAIFLIAGNAMALNITIDDNRQSSGTWYSPTTEDQEVEPGMVNTQVWDLEGFFLEGNTLSMVGGFNFAASAPGYNYTSGDIFIDINGDAEYGDSAGTNPDLDNYGYDYVIHVNDWAATSYDVYALDSDSVLTDVLSYNNPMSNPWTFTPDTGDTAIASGNFTYASGLSDADSGGFLGDYGGAASHYMVSGFDLSFLDSGTDFTVHFTMECGNDNLMGSGTTPIPEPASMLLLGTGLMGMAGIGRKTIVKKKR